MVSCFFAKAFLLQRELLGFLCAIGMFEQYTLMSSLTVHSIDYVKGFSCLNLIKNYIRIGLSMHSDDVLYFDVYINTK